MSERDDVNEGCVVTSDGIHRWNDYANGTFCDFCGERKPDNKLDRQRRRAEASSYFAPTGRYWAH